MLDIIEKQVAKRREEKEREELAKEAKNARLRRAGEELVSRLLTLVGLTGKGSYNIMIDHDVQAHKVTVYYGNGVRDMVPVALKEREPGEFGYSPAPWVYNSSYHRELDTLVAFIARRVANAMGTEVERSDRKQAAVTKLHDIAGAARDELGSFSLDLGEEERQKELARIVSAHPIDKGYRIKPEIITT